jgi:hypothetical protein
LTITDARNVSKKKKTGNPIEFDTRVERRRIGGVRVRNGESATAAQSCKRRTQYGAYHVSIFVDLVSSGDGQRTQVSVFERIFMSQKRRNLCKVNYFTSTVILGHSNRPQDKILIIRYCKFLSKRFGILRCVGNSR